MSKQDRIVHYLGSSQKVIIETLAIDGAFVSNDIAKKLDKDPAAVSRSYKKLVSMGLIKQVGKKEYRGRLFDKYWLTCQGVKHALLFDADYRVMKTHAEQYYHGKDLENISIWIDMGMFDKPVLKAALAFMNGDSVSFNDQLINAFKNNAHLVPMFMKKNPTVGETVEDILDQRDSVLKELKK